MQERFLEHLPRVCEALGTKGVKFPSVRAKQAWQELEAGQWDRNNGELDVGAVVAGVEEAVEAKERGRGSVLCFLPGLREIGKVARELENGPLGSGLWVLQLHGGGSSAEQV